MPKERIYSDSRSDNRDDLIVQWGKANDAAHDRDDDGYNGDVFLSVVDATGDIGDAKAYVVVDRTAINKLIRVLRRARDQAYGADA